MPKEEPVVFVRRASGLVRELGSLDIMAAVMATVVGAGILYFAVKAPVDFPGASIPGAYLIAALLEIPFVACMGLMVTSLPRSGGLYVPISRVLNPTIGFVGGWAFFICLGLVIGVVSFVSMLTLGTGFIIIGSLIGPLKGVGSALCSPIGSTMGALVLLFIAWMLILRGIRASKNVIRAIVFIPFIVLVAVALYFLAIGPGGAASNIDTVWGPGVFSSVIASAKGAGWKSVPFTLGATVPALLAVLWAYGGSENAANLGGEMRMMGKKIMYSFIAAITIVAVIYLLVTTATYHSFGDFIPAYAYLQTNAPNTLEGIIPGAVEPSIPFYMASSITSPWVAFVLILLLALWPINSVIIITLGCSRLLFGMSFDRALPERISSVNKRGSPTWATHLTVLIAIIGIFIIRQGVSSLLGILTITNVTIYWLFGLAVAVLPFLRPDIFDRIPVKSKFAVSAIGVYSFCFGFFAFLLAATELTIHMILMFIALLLIGLILYGWQQNKNVEKGIDLGKIYAQIPPG